MRIRNIFILISFICPSITKASDGIHQNVSPKSPEAAAFDRVSDIPVSNYAGNMNLSIPLLSIDNGSIKLPISLDYQGTAIRVDQEATWVGLNWLLNAGGAITTRLAPSHQSNSLSPGDIKEDWNHLLNDLSFSYIYPDKGDYEQNIGYKVDGMHPDWRGRYGGNSFQKMVEDYAGRNNHNDLSYNLYNLILNYDEGESPTFHATFMGNTLTFIWDRMKEDFFITGCKKNFKIEGKPGNTITITDGQGVAYRFWVTERAYPDGANIPDNLRNFDYTYYLSQIVSPTGKKITLNYTDNGISHPVYKVTETLYDNTYPSSVIYKRGHLSSQVGTRHTISERTLSPYYVIESKRLLSITTDDAVIKFNVSSDKRKDINGDSHQLDNIELYKIVQGNSQELVKRIHFKYSYFEKSEVGGNVVKDYLDEMGNGTDLYKTWFPDDGFMYLRLKLDEVWEEVPGKDNTIERKPSYRFFYNGNLPCKASAAIDYWGYYNGKENHNGKYHTQVPKAWDKDTDDNTYEFIDSYKDVCADRRPDEQCSQTGMLTGMDYPTGGSVSFKYEAHKFGNLKYLDSKRTSLKSKSFTKTTVYVSNNPIYSNPNGTETEKTIDIKEDAVLDLQISYTKSDQQYKSSWRYMLPHSVLIKKFGYIYDQSGQHETVKSVTVFKLNASDTLIAPYPPKELRYWILSSHNLTPGQSPLVGYSKVTTIRTGGTDTNGYNVYSYWNNRWGETSNFRFLRRIEDPRNGYLISEKLYDNKKQLIQETSNEYMLECNDTRLLNVVVENIYCGRSEATGSSIAASSNAYASILGGGCMQIYIYPSVQFTLNKSETVIKNYVGTECMTRKKEICYNKVNCKETSVKETASRTGESILTEYVYPIDYKNNVSFVNTLLSKYITDIPIETVSSITNKDGTFISDANMTIYNSVGKPTGIYTYNKTSAQDRSNFVLSNQSFGYDNYEKSVSISYNDTYNPRETIDYGFSHTVYIWGYCNRYPIAVVNGATFAQVASALGGVSQVENIEKAIIPPVTPDDMYRKLSGINGVSVYVYEYNPYIGITRIIAPNGKNTSYGYDTFGRIVNITDHDGIVTDTYEYNYKRK